jgi:hypothetical protein
MRIDRENPDHYLKATISHGDVSRSLQDAGLSLKSLRSSGPGSYPSLDFPHGELTCEDGRCRVILGQMALPPYDRWWTVDLYSNGM